MNSLHDKLTAASEFNKVSKDIPSYVKENINPLFIIRPYQKKALGRFFYFIEDYKKRKKPTHLLFNMATGSGKTLIMASSMLYLYKQGYRNFIFFVNSTNIIEKTRDNFLNSASSKYLFSNKISYEGKDVIVNEVANFEATNKDAINIVFTTVQGLHNTLNTPKENAVTYEDFEDQQIVLLADEAHHINALTKAKLSKGEEGEKVSWEGTVSKVLNSNNENILLDFTATIDLEDESIAKKYSDKLLYKYDLKEFREDLYSKDVQVLPADVEPIYLALNAMVLSQYRLKVAEKNGLFIKPTILMKSKNIKESILFEEEYFKFIEKLSSSHLEEVRSNGLSTKIIKKAFAFFESQNITMNNLANEIKEAFSKEKTISVNSKNDTDEKQLTINSLEDENNHIRVIFAVDKLNEGWDVLNLFDIVRLYETRDASKGKPGKTTMAEAQLIGRGARYCPFIINSDDDKYKRKYDLDIDNELRVLEELYYHSQQDSRYISELHKALVQTGIKEDTTVQRQLKIKDSFKQTDFWKYGKIFLNEKRENTRNDIFGLDKKVISSKHFSYILRTGSTQSISVFEELTKENTIHSKETKEKTFQFIEFGPLIIMKAIQKLEFYKFSNLKKFFPKLSSIKEFIMDDNYLADIVVDVTATKNKLLKLSADDKLKMVIDTLIKVENEIMINDVDYKGTKEFKIHSISSVFEKEPIMSIQGDSEKAKGMLGNPRDDLSLNLMDKDWYMHTENYGTDQEKLLVQFINNYIDELKNVFEEVYLIRNEKHFKIYDFSDGKAFEPDFVLFLKEKDNKELITYQLFIEPKGAHLLDTDAWKENFLKKINHKYKITVKFENKDFKLYGLPFFNKGERDEEFKDGFKSVMSIAS